MLKCSSSKDFYLCCKGESVAHKLNSLNKSSNSVPLVPDRPLSLFVCFHVPCCSPHPPPPAPPEVPGNKLFTACDHTETDYHWCDAYDLYHLLQPTRHPTQKEHWKGRCKQRGGPGLRTLKEAWTNTFSQKCTWSKQTRGRDHLLFWPTISLEFWVSEKCKWWVTSRHWKLEVFIWQTVLTILKSTFWVLPSVLLSVS